MNTIIIDGKPVDLSGLPPHIKESLERDLRFGSLFPLQGSINVPPYALTDLRYRLIQLHEAMHALHYQFRFETRDKLREQLWKEINEGKLDRGPLIPAPQFFPRNKQIPEGFKVLFESDSGASATGNIHFGELMINMILVQSDELFVEFFSSAAASTPYWITCRDFAFDALKEDRLLNRAHWYAESPDIFDPHPALWLRLYALPQIFLKVLGQAIEKSPMKEPSLFVQGEDALERWEVCRLTSSDAAGRVGVILNT